MKNKRKVRLVILGFIFLVTPLAKISSTPQGDSLLEGIEAFQQGDFQTAVFRFREVLTDPQERPFHGDAYFWVARSFLALNRLEEASRHLEFFLLHFKDNPYFMEAYFEKGRLLFLQRQYGESIEHLSQFLKKFPDSPYAANAYYWIGEAAFSLGRLAEAERLFNFVVTHYPTSFRAEAARYRLDIVNLKFREEELLKLLQWSHEEHLRAMEEFRKREGIYIETIKSYQRRITLLSAPDRQEEIIRLSEQLRAAEIELARLKREGVEGEAAVEANSIRNLLELLEVKQEALTLKEDYLERLKREVIRSEEKKE